jgi:penicillin-binding protein 1A
MLQNPNLYDPRRRPEKCLDRRNIVLAQMVKYGYLPESEAAEMQEKPIQLKFKIENHNTGLAPYFREAIKKQLLAIIAEINESRGDDEQLNLYTSGLKFIVRLILACNSTLKNPFANT